MIKTIRISLIIILLASISSMLITGCGTTTKLLGSWSKYPDKPTHFNNIAIIGVARNADIRKVVEDKMEMALRAQGIIANGALTFLPPDATKDNMERELVAAFLQSAKADAVMLISLLRREDQKETVSGGYYYNYPYSDVHFNDYYGQMRNYVYAPSYETTTTDLFLEVNIYSFPTGDLYWTAQTETADFSSVEITADQLSKVIVKELIDKNVLSAH